MKSTILKSAILILFISLSACNPNSKSQLTLPDGTNDSLSNLEDGFLPGTISAEGALVDKAADLSFVLKSGFSVKLFKGKKVNGTDYVVLPEKKYVYLYPKALVRCTAGADDEKKYVNLGCSDIPPSQIEGMTELRVGNLTDYDDYHSFNARVGKAFVCGDIHINSYVDLCANELNLENAKITSATKYARLLLVRTRKLNITGSNKIVTQGYDSATASRTGSILLTVQDTVSGSGMVELTSIGGSRLK